MSAATSPIRPTWILVALLALAGCEGDDPGRTRPRVPEADRRTAADPLETPGSKAMNMRAPNRFRVRFETTRGVILVESVREWAPIGVDRFYNLVRHGFFDDQRIFRVEPGWVAQFGIHGNPRIAARWLTANLRDDPVRESNAEGTLSFATAGKNTRTTQVFINLKDNVGLDARGFAPFAKVVEGMDVVKSLHGGYFTGPGTGPDQARIQQEGNAYLDAEFPKLDRIRRASLVTDVR